VKATKPAVTFVDVALDVYEVYVNDRLAGSIGLSNHDGWWYLFAGEDDAPAEAIVGRYRELWDAREGASKWLPTGTREFMEER
jgi:hypothetical protein